MSEERMRLERAIAAQEALRASLGDEVVDATVSALRDVLTSLPAAEVAEHRRLVTILFADLIGFTEIAEGRDAEELREAMNRVWSRVDAAIERHGGVIDKHIGDAVMAVWGAVEARENDPERAIRAGLDIQESVAGLEIGGRAARFRVAINTGPVVVGAMGTRGETSVLGDAVNVASRLEEVAEAGTILVSHDTYRHVRGVFDVQELEPVAVRGRVEPVRIYTIHRAKQRAFKLQTRGVEGVETPMVGREAELARLLESIRSVIDDRELVAVTVLGEAGLGKSRLLYEFSDAVELLPERVRMFTGRALPESRTVPYALARDAFAFRFAIQDSDTPEMARAKLERGVRQFIRDRDEATEVAHRLGHLLGWDLSSSPWVKPLLADPRRLREAGFDAATAFLRAVAADLPSVVLLEDIHWADDASLDLVDHLIRTCEDEPILILSLARPLLIERRPSWGEGRSNHVRIPLQPLTRRQSRRLVEEILREAESVPEALRELVVAGAEGNPFYLEELVKMMIDEGVIRTGTTPWRVDATRLAEVRVPPTLTGILQARLDRLAPGERDVLQRASVVGREFWVEAVERLEPGDVDVGAALESLRRKELVYRRESSAFEGAREYLFKHALLRDVTYESVLLRDRRRWHARVAQWFTERGGEGASRLAGVIADHWDRADEKAVAAVWYARAAEHERRAFELEAAVGYYERALALACDDCPDPPPTLEWRAGLALSLGTLARFGDALAAWDALREEARAAGDPVAEAQAWNGRAFVQQRLGDYHGLIGSATRAEEIAAEAGSTPGAPLERVVALIRMSDGKYRLGDSPAQVQLAERALALATSLGAPRERALSLKLLGMGHQTAGRFEEARAAKEAALAILRETEDRPAVGMMLNSVGETYRLKGDYAAALETYREAYAVSREVGNRPEQILCLSNIAGARLGLGDYAGAEVDARAAIEMAGAAGYHVLAEARRFLAEAVLEQGKIEEALREATTSLALSLEENPDHRGHAWRALGRVASRLGRAVEIDGQARSASECFAEAERVFSQSGMDPERARTLRDWAIHERAAGDAARGAAMWEEACATFRRFGMDAEVERMREVA